MNQVRQIAPVVGRFVPQENLQIEAHASTQGSVA